MAKFRKILKRGKVTKDKKQDRKIRQIMLWSKPELKQKVTNQAADAIPAQATNALVATQITDIAAGTAGNQRIGDAVQVHKIEFALSCSNLNTSASQLQFVRVMIVQDQRYNGTAPTGGELLQSYNVTDVSMSNAYSAYNTAFIRSKLANRAGNIRVLFDRCLYLSTNVLTTSGTSFHPQAHVRFSKVFRKPLTVGYEGANYEAGQIFVCVFPGSDTTANVNPYYAWQATVRYSDS